jgi:hypothetical protein
MWTLLYIIPLLSNTFAHVVQAQALQGIAKLKTETRYVEVFTNTVSSNVIVTLEQRESRNFKRDQGEDTGTAYSGQGPNVEQPSIQDQYNTLLGEIRTLRGSLDTINQHMQVIRNEISTYRSLPNRAIESYSTQGVRALNDRASKMLVRAINERDAVIDQLLLRKQSLESLFGEAAKENESELQEKIQVSVAELASFLRRTGMPDEEQTRLEFEKNDTAASDLRVLHTSLGEIQHVADRRVASLKSIKSRTPFQDAMLDYARSMRSRITAERTATLSQLKGRHAYTKFLRDHRVTEGSDLQKRIQASIDRGELFFESIRGNEGSVVGEKPAEPK